MRLVAWLAVGRGEFFPVRFGEIEEEIVKGIQTPFFTVFLPFSHFLFLPSFLTLSPLLSLDFFSSVSERSSLFFVFVAWFVSSVSESLISSFVYTSSFPYSEVFGLSFGEIRLGVYLYVVAS